MVMVQDKDRMTVDLNKMKKEIEKTKLSDMEQNEAQRDLQRCMNVPVKSDRLTEYILSDEHLAEGKLYCDSVCLRQLSIKSFEFQAIIRPIMNEVLNVKPGVENPKHPSHKPTYSPLKAMICLVTSMVRNVSYSLYLNRLHDVIFFSSKGMLKRQLSTNPGV